MSLSASPRTITKPQFITEQVESIFAAFFSKPPEINYSTYISALDDIPVETLRKVFKDALKLKYCPTASELRRLSGIGNVQLPDDHDKPSAELTAAIEAAQAPGVSDWEQIVMWCCSLEAPRWGRSAGDGISMIDPDGRIGKNSWAEPNEQGYVVVRTQGKEFIGYDALRTALQDRAAFEEGHGILFLTQKGDLPGLSIKTWVPVKFSWTGERYTVRHAYTGVFPNYDTPLF
jgi:hypothetical protein